MWNVSVERDAGAFEHVAKTLTAQTAFSYVCATPESWLQHPAYEDYSSPETYAAKHTIEGKLKGGRVQFFVYGFRELTDKQSQIEFDAFTDWQDIAWSNRVPVKLTARKAFWVVLHGKPQAAPFPTLDGALRHAVYMASVRQLSRTEDVVIWFSNHGNRRGQKLLVHDMRMLVQMR